MKFITVSLLASLFLFACGGAQQPEVIKEQPAADSKMSATFKRTYIGKLGTDSVLLVLDVNENIIAGKYFYLGKKDEVILSGSISGQDSLHMEGLDPKNNNHLVFNGIFKDKLLMGGYVIDIGNAKSQQPSGFSLTETAMEYSPSLYAGIDTVAYTMVKKERKQADVRCNAKIEYPLISNPENKPGIIKINQALKKYFEPTLSECNGIDRDEYSKDLPDYESEAIGDIIYNKNGILGVNMGSYSYTGGAHPNHSTSTLYFETETGRELNLIDLVPASNLKKLSGIALKNFKKKNKVKKGVDAGLFAEDVPLKGSESFSIQDTTITLLFSPYEIGPYAAGDFEIVVGYSQLRLLANTSGPFKVLFE